MHIAVQPSPKHSDTSQPPLQPHVAIWIGSSKWDAGGSIIWDFLEGCFKGLIHLGRAFFCAPPPPRSSSFFHPMKGSSSCPGPWGGLEEEATSQEGGAERQGPEPLMTPQSLHTCPAWPTCRSGHKRDKLLSCASYHVCFYYCMQ